MKRIRQTSSVLAVALLLAIATTALGAPRKEHSQKTLTVYGRVLEVNQEARTMLVSDLWSKKLFLVNVPKGATYKITFGLNMSASTPELWQTHRNDRVQVRCVRTPEHLARLDDGRQVTVLSVIN